MQTLTQTFDIKNQGVGGTQLLYLKDLSFKIFEYYKII